MESRDLPSTSSLFINGQPMVETRANYLNVIKYLTVAPDQQGNPVFRGSDMKAIEQLEDPRRREIFNAMSNNPDRTFHFTDFAAAYKNFEMRIDIITFMNEVGHQAIPAVNKLHLQFYYYDETHPPDANPKYRAVVKAPPGTTLPSREFQYVGPDAYGAIMSITAAPYFGECEGTAEITLLYAAAQVMGPQAFNQMFRTGPAGNDVLVFGPQLSGQPGPSVLSVLPRAQQLFAGYNIETISTQDMVPGDWVYMQNTPQYQVVAPTGYWNGENAIYMGQYDSVLNGTPVWKVGATPRFTGLGVGSNLADLSEAQLVQDLWDGYTRDAGLPQSSVPPNSGIFWYMDVGPGTTPY